MPLEKAARSLVPLCRRAEGAASGVGTMQAQLSGHVTTIVKSGFPKGIQTQSDGID